MKKITCIKAKVDIYLFFCTNDGKNKAAMLSKCEFADVIRKDCKFVCKFESNACCTNQDVKNQIIQECFNKDHERFFYV